MGPPRPNSRLINSRNARERMKRDTHEFCLNTILSFIVIFHFQALELANGFAASFW